MGLSDISFLFFARPSVIAGMDAACGDVRVRSKLKRKPIGEQSFGLARN
jgi:hypothetical protein